MLELRKRGRCGCKTLGTNVLLVSMVSLPDAPRRAFEFYGEETHTLESAAIHISRDKYTKTGQTLIPPVAHKNPNDAATTCGGAIPDRGDQRTRRGVLAILWGPLCLLRGAAFRNCGE